MKKEKIDKPIIKVMAGEMIRMIGRTAANNVRRFFFVVNQL